MARLGRNFFGQVGVQRGELREPLIHHRLEVLRREPPVVVEAQAGESVENANVQVPAEFYVERTDPALLQERLHFLGASRSLKGVNAVEAGGVPAGAAR